MGRLVYNNEIYKTKVCLKKVNNRILFHFRKVFGDYASSLNNIGLTYSLFGDYDNALKFYEESLQLRKRIFG
jgi:tetratricopeptide (TPR) repeat protein